MYASELVKRVAALPVNLQIILEEISHGLSHAKIAKKFNYTEGSVRTKVAEIFKRLGLGKDIVFSRIEKRTMASDAFKLWEAEVRAPGRLESELVRLGHQGYEVETVIDVPTGSREGVTRIILLTH